MTRLPKALRPWAGPVIVLLIQSFLMHAWVESKREELDRLKESEASLRQAFEAKQQETGLLEPMLEQASSMQLMLQLHLRFLPSRFEGIDDQLLASAATLGVSVVRFVTDKESQKEFYASRPVHIEATGGYRQLLSWLDVAIGSPGCEIDPSLLGCLGWRARVRELKLDSLKRGELRITLEMEQLRYLDESEVEAP